MPARAGFDVQATPRTDAELPDILRVFSPTHRASSGLSNGPTTLICLAPAPVAAQTSAVESAADEEGGGRGGFQAWGQRPPKQ